MNGVWWKCVKFSPNSSDQEVEDSDHGDPDEDVQGPLDHRAVQKSSGTLPAGMGRVYPAGVRHGGSGHRGAAGGGVGHLVRH